MILQLSTLAFLAGQVSPADVGNAVDKAAEALVAHVKLGEAMTANYNSGDQGFEELVLYALIHAGVDPAAAPVDRLLKQALSDPLRRTYQVSLIAMSLAAIDPQKYRGRIAECAQYLVDLQCENGQWDYGFEPPKPAPPPSKDVATGTARPASPAPSASPSPAVSSTSKISIKRSRRGNAVGDNSNAQYAAMGLRACLKAGIEIEKPTMEKALAWWEKSQLEDGSWPYCFQGSIQKSDTGYGSMTAGGLASVILWRQALGQDAKGAKSVKAAIEWLGKQFSVEANPKEPDRPRWHYYWLYALERAGDLAGLEKFGTRAWYDEGAAELLKRQNSMGWWIGPVHDFRTADTCFAILFLRRATKQPVKVATGR